jgi:hypothetical protein
VKSAAGFELKAVPIRSTGCQIYNVSPDPPAPVRALVLADLSRRRLRAHPRERTRAISPLFCVRPRPDVGDAVCLRKVGAAGGPAPSPLRRDCRPWHSVNSQAPPASARLMQELLALLQDAGHTDFRDARGPMGFTQRQSAGKFTREEATAFIDRLQDAQFDNGSAPAAARPAARLSAQEQAIRRMPAEQLAAELRRRGWVVVEP